MPSYVYKAKKDTAETVVGHIQAQNEDEAVELISQLGLLPVEIEEESLSGGLAKNIRARKIKGKELFSFCRQLGTLLKSGLPLLRSLDMLMKQTSNAYLHQVLSQVSIHVKNGRTLSDAMSDYDKIFSPLFVAMIRAGEEGGQLKEMLFSLAGYQKKRDDIASKVRSALVYPVLMGAVGLGTVIFTLTFVLPKIAVLFQGLNTELPWSTVVVLNISYFFQKSWVWLVVALPIFLVGFRLLKRSARVRSSINSIFLQTPFLGSFLLKVELERFCRTLQLLLKSGIPILRSLDIATPTVKMEKLSVILKQSRQSLQEGGRFAMSLHEAKVFPEMFIQLIGIGEESGTLPDSLEEVADSYENEISEATKTMTTLLEPIMILTVGLLVGFIIFAMLMPIFQMDIFSR